MKRYFRLTVAALAMIVVTVLSAVLTLRIALHGREVAIPDFAGMTVGEASEAALHNGLDLNIENKFYSTTIPAGRLLAQAPAPGSRVRRGWQVRVTESLGPQQVTIPDTNGMPIRQATMSLRRNQLDLGTIAHIGAPGEADIVLAQTPPPNAGGNNTAGVDQPRVNLLLSAASASEADAFVMPSFVGMAFSTANRAAIALGLRVAAIGDFTVAPPAPAAPAPATSAAGESIPGATSDSSAQPAPAASAGPAGPVTSQSPESGHRTARGATVRLIFGHSYGSGSSGSAPASSAIPSTSTSPAPVPSPPTP